MTGLDHDYIATWDGTAWGMVATNDTIYIGGNFTNTRETRYRDHWSCAWCGAVHFERRGKCPDCGGPRLDL